MAETAIMILRRGSQERYVVWSLLTKSLAAEGKRLFTADATFFAIDGLVSVGGPCDPPATP